MAFNTPDLIANKPPSSVKITVVNHPRPFEYNAISVLVKPVPYKKLLTFCQEKPHQF